MPVHRYISPDEDSARWERFAFRPGDIVVSARSKHGTTWVQSVLLMLIHRTPELPAPLADLSPWLDHKIEPVETVMARLEAQTHRRAVKTHTPLDGVPADRRAHYVIVARHPLDAAVSLYHQGGNIDRRRLAELTGTVEAPRPPQQPGVEEWLAAWINADPDPRAQLDSLPGVMWHLTDAWGRREAGNVALVHFDDLLGDLKGQMHRLADLLGIDVAFGRLEELVTAASFDAMRARATQFVPDRVGVLRDPTAFFRQGRSGTGRELLDPGTLGRYQRRCSELAPAGLLDWLHRPSPTRAAS